MASLTVTYPVIGPLLILTLLVVPVLLYIVSVVLLRARFNAVRDSVPSESLTPRYANRFFVIMGYGAAPVLFGFALLSLSLPYADTLNQPGTGSAGPLGELLVWTAVAFSVAVCATLIGTLLVLHSRMGSFLSSDFRRVLPLAVIPYTASVFAFVVAFLVLRYVGYVLGGGTVAAPDRLSAVVSALQAFAVSMLAMPVGSAVSNRVKDLGLRGFRRAALIADLGEVPMVVGLVWAFLAIGGLNSA